jgi:hypothetical protein
MNDLIFLHNYYTYLLNKAFLVQVSGVITFRK